VGVTLVTALVDIGREAWPVLARSFETYLRSMEPLLALDARLVVLADRKAERFIRDRRRGMESRTEVRPLAVERLPCYRYLEAFARVMATGEYRAGNDLVAHGLPEATVPLYNVLVNSKIHLLGDVAAEAPFGDPLHFWIDAGFGGGDPGHFEHRWPRDVDWDRSREVMLLFQLTSFVSAMYEFPRERGLPGHLDLGRDVALLGWHHLLRNFHATELWKRRFPPVVAGGMFGGTAAAIAHLRRACTETLEDCLARGIADDEQTTFALCVMKDPRACRRWRTRSWFSPFGDLCDLLGPNKGWLEERASPTLAVDHA
jgi:hypothetical protein